MENKRGTGKIHHENESAQTEALAEKLAQQVAPAAYLAGQRLIGTEQVAPDQYLMRFEGEWDMLITGVFNISLRENRAPAFAESRVVKPHEDDIDGEVVGEELVEEGKRLMSGDGA